MVRFMPFKKIYHAFVLTLLLWIPHTYAAVILQYHHVSEELPKVTSVSAVTFRTHLQYLKDNQFNVMPLDGMLNTLRSGKDLPPKSVAITFDDGYDNNIEQAAPILQQFGFPYTIFVNPQLIDENKHYVMTWEQLRSLAKNGALIANHSAKHDYLHKRLKGESKAQWLTRIKQDLTWSEQRIKEEVGHNVKMIAYPYGEFNNDLQALVAELGFIGIGQHSGAVAKSTDFTRLPRFPASGVYSNLKTLKTKLHSLAFNIKTLDYVDSVTQEIQPSLVITFAEQDFYQSQFACFVSGVGKAELTWQDKNTVQVKTPKALGNGRSRYNCTAPSKTHKGQFYWFSQPWVVEK